MPTHLNRAKHDPTARTTTNFVILNEVKDLLFTQSTRLTSEAAGAFRPGPLPGRSQRIQPPCLDPRVFGML